MNLTINIYYKGKNGSAREFVKEMIAVNRDTCNYIRAKVLRDIGFRKYYY